jgi:GT2 family glycosyltransferase
MRVTILTCTPDIESKIFRAHATALKTHTSDFDWLIFDNNSTPDFNHALDINKAIAVASSRYLVTLDDDLIVTEGWLRGFIESVNYSQVIGGVHRYKNGTINHSGGYILPNGIAGHFTGTIPRLAYVQYVCSAILLMDLEFVKKNSLYFDEGFSKFFQEADFCFRVWEAGGSVAITNRCDVTHLVGQVVVRLADRSRLFEIDSQYFYKKWILRGRLKILMQKIENCLYKKYRGNLKRLGKLHVAYDEVVQKRNFQAQKKIVDELKLFRDYDSAKKLVAAFELQGKKALGDK